LRWRDQSHHVALSLDTAPRAASLDFLVQKLHQMAGAKPTDARDLASALQRYASDHERQFPTNLDQTAVYLGKEKLVLSGTNQFEIVYQGSLERLQGIPLGTVAVIRDEQTWKGPDGKIMHAELRLGNSKIMVNDGMMGGKGPHAFGGSPASLIVTPRVESRRYSSIAYPSGPGVSLARRARIV
jgi:hypothetical protein